MMKPTLQRLGCAVLAVALSACNEASLPPPEIVAARGGAVGPVAPVRPVLHSERGGIGLRQVESPKVSALAVLPVDGRKSLAVTDKAILGVFNLKAVLDQMVAQNGGTGFTGEQLFRQIWDTQNAAPGQMDLPGAPHCTDNFNRLNGFPYPCRPSEGGQAPLAGPSATVNDYTAIGLFNRFDLAPADGSDCGEHRIVFAKKPGIGPGRNYIIFEAVLPNPRVDLGLEGCRPVADFWSELSDAALTLADRTARLKDFYFLGLPGFPPVIDMRHFGGNPGGKGQVRTNQFMAGPWLLREFKLNQFCGAPPCTLKFTPVTVKTNPFGDLFTNGSPEPLAPEFQNTFFPSQVAKLAVNDLNAFNYEVPDKFNVGQSDAQTFGAVDNFMARFGGGASPLRTNIQTQLTRLGSTLTPDDVVARAEVLSCGGCHQRSNGRALGGGLMWPVSLGFVHNSEFNDPADPTRFDISPALRNVFLPHRKLVLESFLSTPLMGAAFSGMSAPSTVVAGSSFSVSVTMTNMGTTAWSELNTYRLASLTFPTWGVSRVPLNPGEFIHSGDGKSFIFTVTAPTVPGPYTFQWQMVQDTGPIFFGAITPPLTINVVP